jgi:uncharacterized protein
VQWLAEVLRETDAEAHESGSVTLEVIVQPKGNVVTSGRLVANFNVPCGRCLEPAWVDATTKLVAMFVPAKLPRPMPEDDDGVTLSEGDLDTWPYEGHVIDLEGVVAEHVRLAYPMRALCSRRDQCRGLCSNCGAALNEQPMAQECSNCGEILNGPTVDDPGAKTSALADALKNLKLP